ncbi:galectin-2-like, partial [Seriola lalandi dorsalis]
VFSVKTRPSIHPSIQVTSHVPLCRFHLQKVKNMTFKEGHEFKIRIKPKDDCNTFAINIGHDSENIAMHFNPRFSDNTIVCNSLSGGCWGDEQCEGILPFSPGEECKVCW